MENQQGIDNRTFRRFAALIYDKCGIVISEKKRALLQARLTKRMRKTGHKNYRDYLEMIEADESGNEIPALLDAISTNVTHFFREARHFELLESWLTRWEQSGQRRFRIWCAAASTGEEPYSLAITATEALSASVDVKILATDISTQVIAAARRGVYRADKMKPVDPRILATYFTRQMEDGQHVYAANSALKRMIHFGRINLAHPPFPLHGPLDVIFCRNVMIYFDNAVRIRMIEDFMRLLRPGGLLVVGHAESLTGSLTGKVENLAPAVYRRKKC